LEKCHDRFNGLLKLRFAQESADWIVIRMRVGAQHPNRRIS